MAVVRWDPWRELAGLERQFDEMFGRMGRGRARSAEAGWSPAIDVHQQGDTYVIRAEIAGIPPHQVDVTVDDNVLTISGTREEDRSVEEGQWIRRERFAGRFQRSISLPSGVSTEDISATANNGVIEVRVPCRPSAEPQRIQLQTSDRAQDVDVTSSSGAQAEDDTGTESAATTKRPAKARKASRARKSS